ncbi:fructosamine kinase family protein [Pseudomonadota bacterium]
MPLWDDISEHISAATGSPFICTDRHASSGGCINDSYVLRGGQQSYFIKLNDAHLLPMFEAEAAGLSEIHASQTVRAPQVICHGNSSGQAYLVLEHLNLGRGNSNSHQQLGHDLAQMHRYTNDYFGWQRDNTIGSTPQPNQQSGNWIAFWRDQRLSFQLRLAAQNGYGGRLQSLGEQLLHHLDEFFTHYQPVPSLLHGDLWSGNYAICDNSTPVIFDPATYYGDREADLAMTELFGGFTDDFYAAYNDNYPLDKGYHQRKTLYNLYHILNHLNLFGGGYLDQAECMLAKLVSEVR